MVDIPILNYGGDKPTFNWGGTTLKEWNSWPKILGGKILGGMDQVIGYPKKNWMVDTQLNLPSGYD